jgi:anion-transporting  ArsA/GET3 family ATPase
MPTVLDDLLKREILFVTGKGGVGKSTVAAALALVAAERGLKTLLIDVEAKGDAARFLDAAAPRYEAKEARPNLFHLAIHPEDVLEEYLKVAVKLPRVYRFGPVNKIFEFIATAAPGIKEVLIAGKVGFEARSKRWDLIVVDAAPSGQILSHLRGPKTMQEIVQVGAIRNQTAWVQEILEDPKRTGIVVVSLPEEMPAQETAELLEHAPKAVKTPVVGIIVNRVVPRPQHIDRIRELETRGVEVAGTKISVAFEAAGLFASLADTQAPHLDRLRTLGPPTIEVPFLPVARHELTASTAIAERLAEAGVRGDSSAHALRTPGETGAA